MPAPEQSQPVVVEGDTVEVTVTGRVEAISHDGIYLSNPALEFLGFIPYLSTVRTVVTPTATSPDAHMFEAGDLVASDTDLDRPYVRTRQADGSWLTPKGFRSSVTDAYMSARIEACEFWRVDASNPDAPIEYAIPVPPSTCSYKATCGPVSGGMLTMTSGSPGLEDWERELLSSPHLVTLPEVDATPRFKVGTAYYHPTYPKTLYTREAGGWRSAEVRFSPIPRFLPDDSPYLTQSWVDGLLPAPTPRFKVGTVYNNPATPSAFYLRVVDGWKHTVANELFADTAAEITPGWLDGLVPVAS